MAQVRYLTSSDTMDLAEVDEYVAAIREGYRQRGEGAPAEPRTQLFSDQPNGSMSSYLAILPDTGVMGGYTYTSGFTAGDAWFALPLFDAESGAILAFLEGAAMNPLKTGAVGAVGIDALAREDATSLAIIGSGSQARGQLRAAMTVRDFEEVSVYSPTVEHREAFAREFENEFDARIKPVASSTAAVAEADVVITATKSSSPVFDGEVLSEGTHITAMGQYHPERRELDSTTMERATYVPDLRARAYQDAGAFLLALEDGVIADDHMHAELGEVVVGTASGRESPEDITVFDSGGTAIETIAAGYMLYERAEKEGCGEVLEFPEASRWM